MRTGVRTIAMLLAGALLAAHAWPQAQPRPQVQPRPQAQPQPAPRAGNANPFFPATQALFDGYVRDGKMPGIVAAFGVGDLPTQYVSAGRIALEPTAAPAGPDSLWRVYSMTKPVTAMAAMILIEQGRMRLDQPVSDFLPAFRQMRVQLNPNTLQSRPAMRPITIRNLLTHTAGLGYNIVTTGPLKQAYEREGIVPAAINASVEADLRRTRPTSLQAFAAKTATLPLIADPGTRWSYSIGLDILGAAIERAAGMPFDRFVYERIMVPLRMESSYWTVPPDAAGRLATNYTFLGDRLVPLDPAATSVFRRPPSFPYGGAGLVMSARDYDRFLHMLADRGALDGVRVMKPETVALALSNLLPPGVTYGGVGGQTGGTQAAVPMGYGAGGSVYLADGPGGVPSKGTYGWGGAAGTIAFVDPAKRIRGTIMVNYIPADRWPLRQQAVAAFGRDLARLAGRVGR